MLVAVLYFLGYCLLIAAVFWLVIWVLGLIGIPVPMRPIQLVGAALFIFMLIWFIAHWPAYPRLLLVPVQMLFGG